MCILLSLGSVSAVDTDNYLNDSQSNGIHLSDLDILNNSDLLTDDSNNLSNLYDYNGYDLSNLETSKGYSNDLSNLETSKGSFKDLDNLIQYNTNGTINLNKDYAFTYQSDYNYQGGISITKSLTINGNGHVLDGSKVASIFKITGSNVILNNITFINGGYSNIYPNYGAIGWSGIRGSINNCVFINNSVFYYGGVVRLYNGILNISNSTFINNNGREGGALYAPYGCTFNIDNSTFLNNSASKGGAISGGGLFNVNNSKFINNTANTGGVIFSYNSFKLNKCEFINNSANLGGVIISSSTRMYDNAINECNFTNNSAFSYGGALNIISGKIYNSNFNGNKAKVGGSIFANQVTISDSNFTDNIADGYSVEILNYLYGGSFNNNFDGIKVYEYPVIVANATSISPDGYVCFCVEKNLSAPSRDLLSDKVYGVINSLNGNDVGEYLKILIYYYYNDSANFSDIKDDFQNLIWIFTEDDYLNSNNTTVKNVIDLYNQGVRIPDTHATKVLSNGTTVHIIFRSVLTAAAIQNMIAFKFEYGNDNLTVTKELMPNLKGEIDISLPKADVDVKGPKIDIDAPDLHLKSVNVDVSDYDLKLEDDFDFNLKLDDNLYKYYVGQSLVFRITVKNTGNTTLDNVFIKDYNYSDNLVYVGYDDTFGSWNYVDGAFVLNSPLGPGESRFIFLTFNATKKGNATNNVDAGFENITLANATNSTVIDTLTKLNITKTVNNSNPKYKDLVEYVIVVNNTGIGNATGVIVEEFIPNGLVYISSIISQGVYNESSNLWNVGNLDVNKTACLVITALVNSTGNLVNVVSVNDDQGSNNTTNVSISVNKTVDLEITKDVSKSNPYCGEEITYLIKVTNNGPDEAIDVYGMDILDNSFKFVKAISSKGDYDYKTSTWYIGNLTKGEIAYLNISVILLKSGIFDNIATVNSSVEDFNHSNNIDNVTINVTNNSTHNNNTKEFNNNINQYTNNSNIMEKTGNPLFILLLTLLILPILRRRY